MADSELRSRPKIVRTYNWYGLVLRRKGTLIFFVIVAGILGYLAYLQQPKIFASSLKLMIWNQLPPQLVSGETFVKEVSLGKHSNLIQSELVLTKAAADGELNQLASFADQYSPVPALRLMLKVIAVEGAADTLVLSAKGENPEDLPLILTEIVAAYSKVLGESSAVVSGSAVELIEQLQEKVNQEKFTAEAEYFKLIQKLGVLPSPEMKHFLNPHQPRVQELTQQRSTLGGELMDVQQRLEGIVSVKKLAEPRRSETFKAVALEGAKYLGTSVSDLKPVANEPPSKELPDSNGF